MKRLNFKIKTYLTFLLGMFFLLCNAQVEPKVWLNGIQGTNYDPSKIVDTGWNLNFGGNFIDFRGGNVPVSRIKSSLSIDKCLVNMCDSAGNLLFYSNGSKIFNYEHRLIENGDSLNFNLEYNQRDDTGYYAVQHNGRLAETMMTIPSVKNKNQYYIFYVYYHDWRNYGYPEFRYALLDMSLNNGKGRVLEKEKVLATSENFYPTVSASKHANGKDWWIFVPYLDSSNCYLRCLLDSNGIHVQGKSNCDGIKRNINNIGIFLSSKFSPNGKKFAIITTKGIELFDFDRCTGTFSNYRNSLYPYNDTLIDFDDHPNITICFSPNSKYLYAIYDTRIYQFETEAKDLLSSITRVATFDGFSDFLPTTFFQGQIAPNGKIYISTAGTTRYLHSIENPNEKGIACNVSQHSIRLKTFNGAVPHFPFYSLGTDSCYTNSINTIEQNVRISIYPNPVSEYVYIKNESLRRDNFDIEIFDLLGKKVLSEKSFKERIDVSNFEKGMYLIVLRNKDGELVFKEKMVINR